MTRVSIFLQQTSYGFESSDKASTEISKIANGTTIKVRPGHHKNIADLAISCPHLDLALTFSLCDLKQIHSIMLDSIEQSIVKDYNDASFDYCDVLPPFGIVHVYDLNLVLQCETTEVELTAFFHLLDCFLLEHFLMYTFYEKEMVSKQMVSQACDLKPFTHEGLPCFRVKRVG
ncbi:hypothetical protein ACX1C1_08790 [Paenibacillus sp. strain BS8-2]